MAEPESTTDGRQTAPRDFGPGLQALRVAHSHHLVLTAMADLKASLMFGASLLTIALCVIVALRSDSLTVVNLVPTLTLFLTASLVGMISLKALTPRLLQLTKSDAQPEVNLLFCGHFSQMEEEVYLERLKEQLGSEAQAFDLLARDLYQMGLVLHQMKLRAVARAVTVATLGLSATLGGFVMVAVYKALQK